MKFKLCFVLVLFLSYCKREISVSMVNATSSDNNLAFALLEGEKWAAEKNSEYVKFHIYPDEVFQISKVELESCEAPLQSPIEIFINFDENIRGLNVNNTKAFYEFSTPVAARSISFNFEKNSGICLKKLSFYDEKKKELKFKTPRIIKGSAVASETSKPEESYGIMNLFDSRFEYAYASVKGGKGVTLKFNFDDKEKIEALKIWNGYQRSDIHCIENGRVKSMFVKGENYEEKITLDDIMGGQIVKLSKPFKGKELTLEVDEIYKGKDVGIVISELRFFDGKEWFMLDPFSRYKEIAKANYSFFTKANLENVLNKSLEGSDKLFTGYEEGGRDESLWKFRLRSDGSMYLEGSTTRIEETAGDYNTIRETQSRRFYALGNYQVLNKQESTGKLQLRIFGFLREYKTTDTSSEEMIYGDCNGCGRDCNKVYSPSEGVKEKIFQEFLELEKNSDGTYSLRNQKKTQHLDFDELLMNIH